MKKAWHIRRAEARDSKALALCIDAAYADYATRIPDLPAVSEGIAGDIANHIVWVAEMDFNIVGGMVLLPQDEFLLLANVAVHPQCSGMGIGSGLLAQADADCKELGLTELRLSTHVDMPENVRLYEHLGWHISKRSGNKVHMTKVL